MPEVLNEKLVERFIKSDKEAFNEIFKAYYESVFKNMYYKTRDYDLACDLTQDAFVKCWETRAKVDSAKSLYYYIVTIATNLMINHYNHQKMKTRHHELIKMDTREESLSADTNMEYQQLQQRIDHVVTKYLPQQCQIVFIMSRYEGKSNGEIAEALNITKKTVENQLYNALRVLRSKVKPEKVA